MASATSAGRPPEAAALRPSSCSSIAAEDAHRGPLAENVDNGGEPSRQANTNTSPHKLLPPTMGEPENDFSKQREIHVPDPKDGVMWASMWKRSPGSFCARVVGAKNVARVNCGDLSIKSNQGTAHPCVMPTT